MEINEKWADIEGYEGIYQVSNAGNIRKIGRWHSGLQEYIPCDPKCVARTGNGHGYMIVCLSKHGRKNHYVHRLVADAFIPNSKNKPEVNHIDSNRHNNMVDNLEWCTRKENMVHARPRMHVRKKSKTNTGERYITYRATKNNYRVIVDQKEYKACKTLQEAIEERDRILEGLTK